MDHPPHQVLAENVVIDQRHSLANAQEALVGGAEPAVRPLAVFLTADVIDQAVVQQCEQRRQLRHHSVIVVARIGDQRFGKGNPHACDAAIDAGHVLGAGPRDIAERATGRGLLLLPAHPPKPQLGAPVVIRRVERINMRRSDRAAAEQGFKPKRRAARIGCSGAECSGHRKRYRRMNEVVRHELQQIGVTRGNERVFPMFGRSVAVRRPEYFGIHPPRQAVHQSAQFWLERGTVQRVDPESAKPLRRQWGTQEMTKAGSRYGLHRCGLHRVARFGSRRSGEWKLRRPSVQPSTVSRSLDQGGRLLSRS